MRSPLLIVLALAGPVLADGARDRLVVVAPAAWASLLEPYLEARRADLDVELVALEDALAARAGADAPERLKRFLYDAWRLRAARYVLLVGDADTLPIRFMVLDRKTPAAHDTAFYPSDLYYADVAADDGSFDDWNAAATGHHATYFGEVHGETNKDGPINLDRISYRPELAVGRWPVSSSAELRVVVAKTVAWDPRRVERPRALLVHAAGWVDARRRLGALGDALAGDWDVDRLIYGDDDPTPAAVAGRLGEGREVALHVGHGSSGTWHGCLGPAEADRLAGAPPAIYFSSGCSTAHLVVEPPYASYLDTDGIVHRGTGAGEIFDGPPPPPAPLQPGRFDETGLGERLLLGPGGAVAYIGCTTGSQPASLTLLDGFAAALAGDRRRLGDAWADALDHYHEAERLSDLVPTDSWYPPSVFFQGMKFILLGDPSLPLP